MIKISDTEYFSNDKTIRFLNMDCNVFMAVCKENEFDLIHNDPPYGIGAENHAGKKENGWTQWDKKDWDSKIPEKYHFELCKKVSKNQIVWGGNYMTDFLSASMGWIIWDKGQRDFSLADGEMAWTSFNKAMRIWEYARAKANQEIKIHQTQKPVELYKWVIDKYTKPTDTILDCFGGSMSNAIACHMKRRKLTIIELDVDYFKSALNRFEIYERQVEDIKEFGYAKTKVGAQNPVLFKIGYNVATVWVLPHLRVFSLQITDKHTAGTKTY